jgi:hypothetical protein
MRAPSPVVAHGATLGVTLRAALAIERVILQATEHPRPVDLGGHILPFGHFSSGAAVDSGLLATLHHAHHVADEVILIEAFEG